LKKISAVYYAELAASTTAESAATARTNYVAALREVQLNANTLIDAQIPFEEAEVQTTNAVLKSGFSLSKIKVTKSPALTYASYGLPIGGEKYIGGTLYKVITDDNTNIPINQILSSIESLTGQSFADFLSSITVDGQPLVKSIQINLGLSADSGGRGQTGDIGLTGTTSDCETPLVCEDCCEPAYPRGPDGEILLEDGRLVYPFNPVTNPLGYIKEVIACDKFKTREKSIRCEGETGFHVIEEPGLSAIYHDDTFTFQTVDGYTPKPYYSPGNRPDPTDPELYRLNGPLWIGGNSSIHNKYCSYTFTDPVTGKQCEIAISESCHCRSSHSLHFSNWGEKPPPFTPIWTDGDPPKGWCEYWRQYIREHPNENIELPVECSPPQVDGRIITSAVSE
jgi:hypothetical protein